MTGSEAIEVQRRADHRDIEGARGRPDGSGAVLQGCDLLQAAQQLWRHGGVGSQRLKALEEENAKRKRLLAESMLDVSTLREMLGKNF
jgi:putative transposase